MEAKTSSVSASEAAASKTASVVVSCASLQNSIKTEVELVVVWDQECNEREKTHHLTYVGDWPVDGVLVLL